MSTLFPRHPEDCPGCALVLERAQLNRLERRKAEAQLALARQIIASQRERVEQIAERAQEPHPMPALVVLDGDVSDGTLTVVRPKRKRTKKAEPMNEP